MKTMETKPMMYSGLFPHSFPKDEILVLTGVNSNIPAGITNVVGVYIENQYGQVLVNYSPKRLVWDIPQGVVEASDESLKHAAARELFEETGIKVEPNQLEQILSLKNYGGTGIPHTFVTTLFRFNADIELPYTDVQSQEPENKTSNLAFVAKNQIPLPRGLSLRVLLEL